MSPGLGGYVVVKYIFQVIWAWVQRRRIFFRNRTLQTKHSVVSVYRCHTEKPSLVYAKPLELFYHSRPVRVFFQILLITALTVWTVKNYVHILKDL